MTIYFYVNKQKPRAVELVQPLMREAEKFGLKVVPTAEEAEVVITLGGDGTILRAVHEYPQQAVLGFNLGGLGYLACVGASSFREAFVALATGAYRLSSRTMLAVRRPKGSEVACALNDIVVMRGLSGHAAVLDLAVEGHQATRYLADGLVVATPTGSTAYSLSAGGPVLLPDSPCLVVTPMNPHALGIRPMVVPDGVTFTVTPRPRLDGGQEALGVSADGESVLELRQGEAIEIFKSAQRASFVELAGFDPYAVLTKKLGWSR